MDKTTLLAELKKQRLVAVIRGKDEEEMCIRDRLSCSRIS